MKCYNNRGYEIMWYTCPPTLSSVIEEIVDLFIKAFSLVHWSEWVDRWTAIFHFPDCCNISLISYLERAIFTSKFVNFTQPLARIFLIRVFYLFVFSPVFSHTLYPSNNPCKHNSFRKCKPVESIKSSLSTTQYSYPGEESETV